MPEAALITAVVGAVGLWKSQDNVLRTPGFGNAKLVLGYTVWR